MLTGGVSSRRILAPDTVEFAAAITAAPLEGARHYEVWSEIDLRSAIARRCRSAGGLQRLATELNHHRRHGHRLDRHRPRFERQWQRQFDDHQVRNVRVSNERGG